MDLFRQILLVQLLRQREQGAASVPVSGDVFHPCRRQGQNVTDGDGLPFRYRKRDPEVRKREPAAGYAHFGVPNDSVGLRRDVLRGLDLNAPLNRANERPGPRFEVEFQRERKTRHCLTR